MKKKERLMGLAVLVITAIGVFVTGEEYTRTQASKPIEKGVIVIDPGHGGKDPGKVGCHGELEKEINLSVAMFLQEELEGAGYKVVLTRTEDTTATGEVDSTKMQDMNARVEVIEKANPICCISIHQNSYTSSSVSGAQTFFYGDSTASEMLAESIQRSLIEIADPGNNREIKSSLDYYLLKSTGCPTVIVECGFLSHEDEALKLSSETYQKKLAKAIREGILFYIEKK